MEADACTYYESMDSDENEIIVGAIPSETLKQFKRRTSNTLFFIRTIKDKLIGMACLSNIKKNIKCLHTVFVKTNYRRNGIGEAIVRKVLHEAKKMKYDVKLKVNPLNDVAIHLYKKIGFKICKCQNIEMQIDYTQNTNKKIK